MRRRRMAAYQVCCPCPQFLQPCLAILEPKCLHASSKTVYMAHQAKLPTDDISSLCCIDTHNCCCCRTMPAPILWDNLLEHIQIKVCRVLLVCILKLTPTPIRHIPQTRATLKTLVVTTQRQQQATTQRLVTQSQAHLQAGTMEFRCSPCHKKNQATRHLCRSTCYGYKCMHSEKMFVSSCCKGSSLVHVQHEEHEMAGGSFYANSTKVEK